MSGHTPGPWKVTPDSFVMAGERPSIGVARVITHAAGFVENARLIAAAPDLLDAALRLLDAPSGSREWFAGRDALIAAIAKAEGR